MLVWRIMCERCSWNAHRVRSREAAIRLGRDHARRCENSADGYQFRVQGLREHQPAAS